MCDKVWSRVWKGRLKKSSISTTEWNCSNQATDFHISMQQRALVWLMMFRNGSGGRELICKVCLLWWGKGKAFTFPWWGFNEIIFVSSGDLCEVSRLNYGIWSSNSQNRGECDGYVSMSCIYWPDLEMGNLFLNYSSRSRAAGACGVLCVLCKF